MPTTVSDFTASQMLVQGVLLALLARERTGRGQRVEVCLVDALLALQQWDEVGRLNLGEQDTGVPDHEHPLQAVYGTADGLVALVGWFRPDPLANVCHALGLPDYSQDPRFATLERLAQPAHAAAMRTIIAARLVERSTAAAARILWGQLRFTVSVLWRGKAAEYAWGERPLPRLLEIVRFFLEDHGPRCAAIGPPATAALPAG